MRRILLIFLLLLSMQVFAQERNNLDEEESRERFGEEYETRFDEGFQRERYGREYRDGEYREEYRREYEDGGIRGEYRERFEDSYDGRDEYRGPDFGYYSGMSNDEMMMEMMFSQMRDFNPEELITYCDTPERIVEILMEKFREHSGGNLANFCSVIDERINECERRVEEGCSQIGGHFGDFRNEEDRINALANECPANGDAIIEQCVYYSGKHNDRRSEHIDEICEQEWHDEQERISRECEEQRRHMDCGNERGFIDECINNYIGNMFIPEPIEPEMHIIEPILERARNCENYEDIKRELHRCEYGIQDIREDACNVDVECNDFDFDSIGRDKEYAEGECKRQWEDMQEGCEYQREVCEKDAYVDRCIRNEREWKEGEDEIRRRCKRESIIQIEERREACKGIDEEKNECYERGKEGCRRLSAMKNECETRMDEEKMREAILMEANKYCKLEVYRDRKEHEVVKRLLELRGKDVPEEYLYVIEDKAEDIVDVNEDIEEINKGKGAVYNIKRFFGLAKEEELKEIEMLKESLVRLENSIKSLKGITSQLQGDTKAIIETQIVLLEKQREDLEEFIRKKEKKAKGLFGIFG